MMHSVLFSMFAATMFATPAATAAPLELHGGHSTPVIKVSTEWDEYSRGQEAQVTVETRDDGYVIVMQADVDGRVRVLYPLDPTDDNFVRGGHSFDIKGRGGKKSFYVDGPGGTGMVYAAYSSVPFHFDAFVSGGHWDYGALYDKTMDSDFENGFTALVDKMSTGHFDYDVARYTVIAETSYSSEQPSVVVGVAGGGCWGPYYAGCFGPAWAPGAYLYGPPLGFGFGVGYYGGGWGFSVGFGYPGYGCCGYYGYGYPYYGYGYPYYGYGYPYYGYGYPYYGYPHYGYGYSPYAPRPYVPPGAGVGYRPRAPGVAGAGFSTPYRRPPGATTGGITNVGFATPPSIGHRSPTRTGWTLGRPTYSRPTTTGPHGTSGSTPMRGPGGAGGAHTGGWTPPPSAREPHAAPPRYDPNAGRGTAPRGAPPTAAPGPRSEPRSSPPSSPPMRSEPSHSAPASKPPLRYGYSPMSDAHSQGWMRSGAAYSNNGSARGYASRPSPYASRPAPYARAPYSYGGHSFMSSGRSAGPSHSYMGGGRAPAGGGHSFSHGGGGGGHHSH